ncbi:MAG: hypothetical protein EOP60_17855 [Sphingomonadales bacterium]|nr:MAG: hypothetical protein EOP60_17855 [Sphingomonadales bacterium]
MDAPGTRYKVVERGRRLEVIDTWNNNATVKPAQPDPVQRAPQLDASGAAEVMRSHRHEAPSPIEAIRAPKLDQRGRGLLHTQGWYDGKGPRQIVVTPQGEEKLKGLRVVAFVALCILAVMVFLFWQLLFIVPFIAFNEGARKGLRSASTKFLDDLNQPVSRG